MKSEDWKKLGKSLVKKGLPLFGTILGGPVGKGLGSVGALISSVLGEETSEDPAAMLAALEAKPELIVELKKAEYTNRESLQKLALQQDKMHLDDVQSARDREVDIVKATGEKDTNLYVLAWIVVAGFFVLILVMAFTEGSFKDNPALMMLIGALSAGFGSVLNYFFGSSSGSKSKSAALTQMMGDK